MSHWIFGELGGAAVRRQPNDEFLFNTAQAGEGEYAGNDALVREILQNAIDARVMDVPVRVRLAIHDANEAPPAKRLAYYFERLRPALVARQFEFNRNGSPKADCRFLVCEDFGTRGLEGDTQLFDDPPEDDRSQQDFYWFWRNIGHSGKTGADLGRWGLGKTVYRSVSRVRCMLGLTVRRSDQKKLLMGQAVLQIHKYGNKEYLPEGYWCGEQNTKGIPLPIEDPRELERFRDEWRLTRYNEPGLSVVAPYIPEELKADRLLQAVLVNFFVPILRGELIVEIVGSELGSVTVESSSISAVCKKVNWDGHPRTKRHVAPPIKFVRQSLGSNQIFDTLLLGQDRVPDLTEQAFRPTDLTNLRQSFSSGELISVRVRLWLLKKQGEGQEGHLDVYLERQGDNSRCDAYFVREGMTIAKINSKACQRGGIRAFVNVESGPLAKLLGDTEGPAHEDWDTSTERPEREWKTWKGRVKFVRAIVDKLVEILTPVTTEPDFDLLSEFFSVEQTGGSQRQKKPGGATSEQTGIEPPVPESKWYSISERTGGFTISRTASVAMPDDPALKVSVAYDLPSVDPLRDWSPIDFRIGNKDGELHPSGEGLRVKAIAGNVLLLTHIQPTFSFSVRGFDQHRDLFVRVDEMADGEDVQQ